MMLSALFDGEEHWLVPGEDFPDTGAAQVIFDWEDEEEEDVLSPFESSSRIPLLRDTETRPLDPRFPLARTEQAWGSLSINLSAFCQIIGVDKDQYQRNYHQDNTVAWTFQAKQALTERM